MEKIRDLNLELVDMDEVVNHPKHYTTGNIVNRRIKELEIQKMEEERRKDGVNPLPCDVLR